MKSQQMRELGLKPTMSMPLCSLGMTVRSYQSWKKHWDEFTRKTGFEDMRPYALRHTLATLNLANGENIKTVSVLMGHASSAYTLDLYASYVPNTGLGIGSRYMDFLRHINCSDLESFRVFNFSLISRSHCAIMRHHAGVAKW